MLALADMYALWVLAGMHLCIPGRVRPRCFSLGPRWPPLVMPTLLVIFHLNKIILCFPKIDLKVLVKCLFNSVAC